MSINKVFISGNITRDSELRQTSGGMPILSMGIAVNDRRKNQQTGEWEDDPNFFDCTMFGSRAEKLQQYLTKGTKVAAEGRLRWSQWTAKDGSKRSKVDIIVDDIEFMSRRQQGTLGAEPTYSTPSPAQPAQPIQPPMMDVPAQAPSLYDEDIPF